MKKTDLEVGKTIKSLTGYKEEYLVTDLYDDYFLAKMIHKTTLSEELYFEYEDLEEFEVLTKVTLFRYLFKDDYETGWSNWTTLEFQDTPMWENSVLLKTETMTVDL